MPALEDGVRQFVSDASSNGGSHSASSLEGSWPSDSERVTAEGRGPETTRPKRPFLFEKILLSFNRFELRK